MERNHAIMYSLLIDAYFKESELCELENGEKMSVRKMLYNSINTFPVLIKMKKWAQGWMTNGSFEEKLLGAMCIEWIIFSGAFAVIYKFKEDGILPGLTMANELISVDEGLHADLGAIIYSYGSQLTDNIVFEMVNTAVELSDELYEYFMPSKLIGMSTKKMAEYIRYIANRLLVGIKYPKLYGNVKNPFDFMDKISQQQKTNFFEHRVTEYQRAQTGTTTFTERMKGVLSEF